MLIDIKEIKDLKEAEIIKRLISIGAITKIGKSYEIQIMKVKLKLETARFILAKTF